jgi:FkbM family methyltransferase
MIKHPPLFYQFTPSTDPFPPGFDRDFIGSVTRFEFCDPPKLDPGFPRLSEEYLEWITLLESIADARDSYTMIELGAGHGRWAARAAVAIKRVRPMPVHLIAVEADPVHFDWIKLHFSDNGIDPSSHALIRAALTGSGAKLPFLIGTPTGVELPNQWYGQALGDWAGAIVDRYVGLYGGFPVRVHENGWRSIDAPVVTLGDILRQVERVDLAHFDIQGVEHEVIQSAMDAVNAKVKRMHIATHSREIDEKLRLLLDRHGWECAMVYPCGETSETAWGPVDFVDGIQYSINPRL